MVPPNLNTTKGGFVMSTAEVSLNSPSVNRTPLETSAEDRAKRYKALRTKARFINTLASLAGILSVGFLVFAVERGNPVYFAMAGGGVYFWVIFGAKSGEIYTRIDTAEMSAKTAVLLEELKQLVGRGAPLA